MVWLVLVLFLLIVGLYLVLPYRITRSLLRSAAESFADPRQPEAAAAVRRTARDCLIFSVFSGVLFSLWCYYNSVTYQRGGAWLDFGKELWYMATFLPIWPVIQVLLANNTPVRIEIHQSQPEIGFSRF